MIAGLLGFGPNIRKSDIVLNTEHAKLQKTKSRDVPDLDVTEERLGDELFNLKVRTHAQFWF